MGKFILLLILLSQLILGGCTTMNSSLDCPNQAGVNCKSLDQINRMVDTGQIRSRSDAHISTCISCVPQFQPFPMSQYWAGSPIRYSETIQRIWIAPYEDTVGNYHQDSLIYSVMQGGHWMGRPVKTVQSL